MATQAEQIAELKARSNAYRSVNITQTSNGFVVAGNTRYVDKDTGGVNLEDNQSAIATSPDTAGDLASVFLGAGTFLPA